MGHDLDFFAKYEVRKRRSAPLREILTLFWSIDGAEPNSDLLFVDQYRERVAVCDADNLAYEVAWSALEDAGEKEEKHQGSSSPFREEFASTVGVSSSISVDGRLAESVFRENSIGRFLPLSLDLYHLGHQITHFVTIEFGYRRNSLDVS
jgi:hypothetical protein